MYAYDELQSLSGESVLPPERLFGTKANGDPFVRFGDQRPGEPKRDVILDRCYRNSRPVLATAHALGFGIYRTPPLRATTGLVQMFDHPQLWTDIGYQRISGILEAGHEVTLARTEESSPKFLELHSDIDDLVQFIAFPDAESQTEWLVKSILADVKEQELRYDDIMVINPDPLTTRERVGPIRRQLLELGVQSHLAGVDTEADVFFRSDFDSITFTGIYRAKGNEAGMVYIIHADDCDAAMRNLARIRNRLFTAITRSKAWVRVLGIGAGMTNLVAEFQRLKERNFELSFRYPTELERNQLLIVHRDMSAEEQKRLQGREKGLVDLVSDLEAGLMRPEDISDEIRKKAAQWLLGRGPDDDGAV